VFGFKSGESLEREGGGWVWERGRGVSAGKNLKAFRTEGCTPGGGGGGGGGNHINKILPTDILVYGETSRPNPDGQGEKGILVNSCFN